MKSYPHFGFIGLLFFCLNSLCGQNQEILGEYKIGIIGQDLEEAIYQAAHHGAKDAALELSRKYSIDVELLVATPKITQGGSQSVSLAELFVDAADGLLLSPNSAEFITSTVEFARQHEQEIVYFESDLPDTKPLAAILADEIAAGQMAAEAILKELPSRGRVAVLTSSQSTTQLEQRLQGVRSALGFKRIQSVVQTDPDYRSAIRAIEAAEEADHNDLISGWIFLEDWPMRGMPVLPWKSGRKPVVAIQSSPSSFVYSEQGYLDALIVHPYYEWGYRGVEVLIEKLHHKREPEDRTVYTKPRVIDWRNFDEYRENWKVWFK